MEGGRKVREIKEREEDKTIKMKKREKERACSRLRREKEERKRRYRGKEKKGKGAWCGWRGGEVRVTLTSTVGDTGEDRSS